VPQLPGTCFQAQAAWSLNLPWKIWLFAVLMNKRPHVPQNGTCLKEDLLVSEIFLLKDRQLQEGVRGS
jgi:hypothetical protein